MTTQKNSLKNSTVKQGNDIKIDRVTCGNRNDRYLSICNETKTKLQEVTFNQSRTEHPSNSIQMLSEISMVEEEFISNESTTLKALNLLSNCSEKKSPSKRSSPPRFGLDTITERSLEEGHKAANPLERLLQKRRMGQPEKERTRLHL